MNIFSYRRNSGKKGFTLIELLVVISIIALLSSVVLASLNTARSKARDTKRIADLKQVQLALEMYYNQYGGYPPAGSTDTSCGVSTYCLAYLKSNSNFLQFLSSIPTAPGGTSYGYRYHRSPTSGSQGYGLTTYRENGGWCVVKTANYAGTLSGYNKPC